MRLTQYFLCSLQSFLNHLLLDTGKQDTKERDRKGDLLFQPQNSHSLQHNGNSPLPNCYALPENSETHIP